MTINILMESIESLKKSLFVQAYFSDIQTCLNYITQRNTRIVNGQQQPGQPIQLNILQQNIQKVIEILENIYSSTISEDINVLFPVDTSIQFNKDTDLEQLKELVSKIDIKNVNNYLSQIQQIVNDVNTHLTDLRKKVQQIESTIAPYITSEVRKRKDVSKGYFGIVFNNIVSYSNLKVLSKNVMKLNNAISVYMQLIHSDSPEDIKISSIEEGSFEIILNINWDIALNLTEIIKTGLYVFGGYLSYIKIAEPLIKTYMGNKQLLEGEDVRKKQMLDNVKESIKNKLLEQYNKFKITNNIECEALDKKIDFISNVFSNHIIKGNSIKLIQPTTSNQQEIELSKELNDESKKIKKNMSLLTDIERSLIEDKYNENSDNEIPMN